MALKVKLKKSGPDTGRPETIPQGTIFEYRGVLHLKTNHNGAVVLETGYLFDSVFGNFMGGVCTPLNTGAVVELEQADNV